MNAFKIPAIIFVIGVHAFLLTGCWNYREIDDLAIVAGIAIDKGLNEKFDITVEIAEIGEDKEPIFDSKIISVEGKSIFDAARHIISMSGKRLYWSHAKAVIISRELAEEGVLQVMDWFSRDAETRADIHVFICSTGTARDILASKGVTERIVSYELEDVLTGQKSLSTAPDMEIWKFTDDMAVKGVSARAAVVNLKNIGDEMVPHIMGMAIFNGDRLAGILDGEETKDLLFVRDEIAGGILVTQHMSGENGMTVALEIFSNKTRIQPVIQNGVIEMNVNIKTVVAIDEIERDIDVINGVGRNELQAYAEKTLEKRIEATVGKIQRQYGVDVFGFGDKLRKTSPEVWEVAGPQWEDIFKNLKVNIHAEINIKNSALLADPLEVND